MNDSKPLFSYTTEMGCTHKELFKGLPSAVAPYRVAQLNALEFRFSDADRRVDMLLKAEFMRKIASLCLPVTPVTLNFYNLPEPEYRRFLQRFRHYLQKGGG